MMGFIQIGFEDVNYRAVVLMVVTRKLIPPPQKLCVPYIEIKRTIKSFTV
jgi:hypothetical protein